MEKLGLDFYLQQDVVALAKDTLGKRLCTNINNQFCSAIITETEAYAGERDKASHAYRGRRTARTEILYRQGGIAYVYLCYGMHSLFNIVTNIENIPHAILIRAIKIEKGIETMLQRSGKPQLKRLDSIGPGKVSKLLGIHHSHSGISLLENEIWLENTDILIKDKDIRTEKRVGIDYAEEDADLPYRFVLDF